MQPLVQSVQSITLAKWVLPIDRPPIEDGFVCVENGRIQAVDKIQTLPTDLQIRLKETDPAYHTRLISPGLVNTHAHLEHSDQPAVPIAPGNSMADWLLAVTRQNMGTSPETRLRRLQTGLAEMLQSGITCINDISSDGQSLLEMAHAGVRGVVSLEWFHASHHPLAVEGIVERYQRISEKYTHHPLLRVGLSPHTPFNVSPNAWRAVVQACHPPVVHTHLAESLDECTWFETGGGKISHLHQAILGQTIAPSILGCSPTQHMARHGLLKDLPGHLIAAHGVFCDATDKALLREANAGVAHCPRSNLFLQQQTLVFEDWLGSGIPLGLGTDSTLSNASLDLREEARVAKRLHHWTDEEAVLRLTLEGASVMGLSSEIGSLTPGKSADCVWWQCVLGAASQNPYSLLLNQTTQMEQAVVAGKPI